MKTVRQFINAVLEAGNWDIRDAFDDIMARDAEHDEEKTAVRAYATRLEAALVRSHACPTVRDNGECDGCYISEALSSWPPVVAAEASMSAGSGNLTTGTQNPICGSNHCRNLPETIPGPAPAAPVEAAPTINSRPEISVADDLSARRFAVSIGVTKPIDLALGAPAPVEHPAPWRWGDDHGDDNLRDANGECLIGSNSGAWPTDDRVRALTEAAPDMEELIRACARHDAGDDDEIAEWARELLARIDERSKGG